MPEQRDAISYLEEAVALAPEWAAAHATLSLAYTFLASSSDVLDTEVEFFGKAKAAAMRALDLDDTEALAHVMLRFVLLSQEWDWANAERELRRGLRRRCPCHQPPSGILTGEQTGDTPRRFA